MPVLDDSEARFDTTIECIVVGAGACGLTAALAAREAGVEPLLVERDATPLGTTSMSTGLIPACGSKLQRAAGIDDDTPARFTDDVMAKTKGRTDEAWVRALTEESAPTIEWLHETHDVPFSLVDTFLYPGHTRMRMHGTPNRTGSELMAALLAAASDIDLLTEARVVDLYAKGDSITGIAIERPDGSREAIGCRTLILACCGFAGDAGLVRTLIPEIADGVFHGHPGNKGDALAWGHALGAATADLDSYQGHGGLAAGYGIPLLWPVIMEGGIQVNAEGRRFSNEAAGYSEQAVKVLAQPGHVAWDIFDARIYAMAQEFDDFRDAIAAGAIRTGADVASLAAACGLPTDALDATLRDVEASVVEHRPDDFGRVFAERPALVAPYYAVRITGALFHTQGGLVVDASARVLHANGNAFPNLFAGGGAARGVSGPGAGGYLAGNGLWTATTLGRLAGRHVGRQLHGIAHA